VLDDGADFQELRVTSSTEGALSVVAVAGELDASSVPRLRAALDALFAEGGSSVVLDLQGISFIDSSGLAALIYAYKEAAARDGRVTLRDPTPTVIDLVKIAGLADRFLNPGP
jgi:anti-sigma B factor antagonist